MDLPIGWNVGLPQQSVKGTPVLPARTDWLQTLLGWLITAFAATLGAPFWFDLLNKVSVIRSAVKPREKSPDEGSEDRQPASSPARVVQPAPTMAGTVSTPMPVSPAAPMRAVSSGRAAPRSTDEESRVDGCDVPIDGQQLTKDDELPEAEGGVA